MTQADFNNKFLKRLQKPENIFSPPGKAKNVHIN